MENCSVFFQLKIQIGHPLDSFAVQDFLNFMVESFASLTAYVFVFFLGNLQVTLIFSAQAPSSTVTVL